MDSTGIVIVGAGLCGATAARTLREEGYTGPLTLIGEEAHPPYLRPPLSKAFLAGTDDESSLQVASGEDYRRLDIELMLGQAARSIDTEEQRVHLADGRSVAYADLLLSTGASPRRLALPGANLEGVLYLRTLDDARAMRNILQRPLQGRPPRLIILGAGWIGMEVAATARGHGSEVTVVAPDDVPLAAALGPRIGAVFARRHEAEGVRFRMASSAREILGLGGRVTGVRLGSGEVLPADAVLIAVGAVPNTALAAAAGLETDNGILVDQFLRTTDPHIYAAGDVALVYDPYLGRHQRSEHWANAIAGGEAAARSILGPGAGLEAVPYFYTDQYDLGMEYAGYSSLAAEARLVLRGEPESGRFVAFWVLPEGDDAGVVVAGMHVNVWKAKKEIQALIASRRPVLLDELTRGQVAVAS
ncbi:NAD(P)/FAD-dependent oxidoreductase [Naasia aerilata]|uniref:Ferredoxin n=1 Tax=Naasia aerilata TaxID=1162966 RepID=A0ABN6XI16_9MICO|nr:FAD-dependent oxidoreductase [Naasia aerilata]BDZ44489.1 ferredoxin [Naasia aerilata]